MLSDPALLAIISLTFVLAGLVKGITGMGLPTVSLALLTVALDLPSAMALLLVPSLVTNLWQGFSGGYLRLLLRQLWPFLLPATLLVAAGALVLTKVEGRYLSATLGGVLVIYAGLGLVGFRPTIGPRQARWCGPFLGVINGLLTGMTGSFVVPGVLYLQAIGLPRDQLIQAMGLLFSLSTLALGLALQSNQLLSAEQGVLSMLALLPALAGMLLGQRIRQRLSESLFRRVFFTSLLLLGLYIVGSALL